MKKCSSCGEEKPFESFSKLSAASDGYRYACRECCKERYYKDHEKNKERIRKCNIKRMYNITPEEYEKILEKQGGVCRICSSRVNDSTKTRFDIDHCHTTGKIRGLLCNSCNRGLGYFKDKKILLASAMAYLDEHDVKESFKISDEPIPWELSE